MALPSGLFVVVSLSQRAGLLWEGAFKEASSFAVELYDDSIDEYGPFYQRTFSTFKEALLHFCSATDNFSAYRHFCYNENEEETQH